jgi:hypothetical protein
MQELAPQIIGRCTDSFLTDDIRQGLDGAKTLITAETAMGKPRNYPTAVLACMYGSTHKAIIGKEASIDGSNAVCSVPN